jgi:hypothetical protein
MEDSKYYEMLGKLHCAGRADRKRLASELARSLEEEPAAPSVRGQIESVLADVRCELAQTKDATRIGELVKSARALSARLR